MVEGEAGEVADHGSHPVLDVEEVGLDVSIQEALEEGTIKQGDIAVGAKAGRRQLVRIPNQQHFLHP